MAGAILLILVLAPSRAQSPSAGEETGRAAQELLDERTAGCAVCARMTRDVLPGQFFHDAHEFACAVCHHPHVRRSDEQWRAVCGMPECHPRAWTETVFHRIDAEVFVDCQNCHKPHVWTADGRDCRSCHQATLEPGVLVETPGVRGEEAFDHARHQHLGCDRCHRSEEKHAVLTMTDGGQCMDCHHGPEAGVDCSACHQAGPAGVHQIPVVFAFDVAEDLRSRDLPFDHGLHGRFACTECHSTGGRRASTDCRRCHDDHHGADATCATCHEAPAAGAHALAVHETRTCGGSGCHTREHAFDPMPEEQRNL